MTRNQKIALGCGGAGCLGLLFVIVVAAGLYIFSLGRLKTNPTNRDYSVDSNLNANSNANVSVDNDNSNDAESTNTSSTNSSRSPSRSSGSMADEDKHKLYHAATLTGDPDVAHRVSVKIGLINEDNTPAPGYVSFLGDHVEWAKNNLEFIQSLNTPAKARAYVDAHMDE